VLCFVLFGVMTSSAGTSEWIQSMEKDTGPGLICEDHIGALLVRSASAARISPSALLCLVNWTGRRSDGREHMYTHSSVRATALS
jgi:hypothetical protein